MSILMTPAEAAEYLRLTPYTLRKYTADAIVPGFKVGWFWRYRREDLDAYLTAASAMTKKDPNHDAR